MNHSDSPPKEDNRLSISYQESSRQLTSMPDSIALDLNFEDESMLEGLRDQLKQEQRNYRKFKQNLVTDGHKSSHRAQAQREKAKIKEFEQKCSLFQHSDMEESEDEEERKKIQDVLKKDIPITVIERIRQKMLYKPKQIQEFPYNDFDVCY